MKVSRLAEHTGFGAAADEYALVARAKAGDADAFSLLLQASDDSMRSLAYRLTGDRATMDDVLQDAYLKAFRSLHSYDAERGGAKFSTWLYRVVHTTCIDHHRRTVRRPQTGLSLVEGIASTQPDPGVTASRRDEIRGALAALPPDQAAVVALVDGEGYSYDDVAETLGINPGTVASRLNRGRTAMRRQLEPTGKAER